MALVEVRWLRCASVIELELVKSIAQSINLLHPKPSDSMQGCRWYRIEPYSKDVHKTPPLVIKRRIDLFVLCDNVRAGIMAFPGPTKQATHQIHDIILLL